MAELSPPVVEKALQKLEDDKFILVPKKVARVNPGRKKAPPAPAEKTYDK